MSLKFFNIVESILLEAVSIDQLRDKYVGDDKPIKETTFGEIIEVSNNKINYILFLVFHIVKGNIFEEDVYKYKRYFEIFDKNKNSFPKKDLGQIKQKEDLNEFLRKCQEIIDQKFEDKGGKEKSKYVSDKNIQELESVGIKFLGIADGYQVFQVTPEANNKQSFVKYKNILGKCSTDDENGEFNDQKIQICTFGWDHYTKYLNDHKGSSYFVMYNLSDPASPYQIHFETGQFMDRADNPIL